jgi:phage gp16-like protein
MPNKKTDRRQQLITLIHVGKKALAMDDDSYRGILMQLALTNSTKSMTVAQLEAVMAHMVKAGFVVAPKGKKPAEAEDKQAIKIKAMWSEMAKSNIIKDGSAAALGAFVKRMTGKDALQWCSTQDLSKVIEALKSWKDRQT